MNWVFRSCWRILLGSSKVQGTLAIASLGRNVLCSSCLAKWGALKTSQSLDLTPEAALWKGSGVKLWSLASRAQTSSAGRLG